MSTNSVLRRVFGLAVSVYLAGLPTYFALFTIGDTGATAAHVKDVAEYLFIAWVLVATGAGYVALIRDNELMRLLRPVRRRFRSARQNDAVTNLLDLLLKDQRFTKLRAFKPTIFVCDDRTHPTELTPFGEDTPRDWQRWRVGYGAVGGAFERNSDSVLLFTGADLQTVNQTLTPEQVARYAGLKLVAAVVIRALDDQPVGALAVSSTTSSGFGPARVDLLKLLASEIGVLVDMVV